jgi:hypothetical protein
LSVRKELLLLELVLPVIVFEFIVLC